MHMGRAVLYKYLLYIERADNQYHNRLTEQGSGRCELFLSDLLLFRSARGRDGQSTELN